MRIPCNVLDKANRQVTGLPDWGSGEDSQIKLRNTKQKQF